MDSLTFFSCLLMTFCSTNGFSISNDFKFFKPTSLLQTNSEEDVFPLKENTIKDLGLKLAKVLTHKSEKNCLKACERTEGCLRAVHCKSKPKCDPGTFCLSEETSTCYLAANIGAPLIPTGSCTVSSEVNFQENDLQAEGKIFTGFKVQGPEAQNIKGSDNKTPIESMSQENQVPPMINDMLSDFISDILPEEVIQSTTNRSNKKHMEISVESVKLEPAQFDGDLENKENPDELLVKESAKVDDVIDNMHSDKKDETFRQESPEVNQVFEDMHSEKSGELALQKSSNGNGLSGNRHLGKQDQLVDKGSSKADGVSASNGVSASSHLEKEDQLVDQRAPNLDGVSGNSYLEKQNQLVGQREPNLDGASENSHLEKQDQSMGQGSSKEEGVSGNSQLEKQDQSMGQGSSKVGGVSGNIPESLEDLSNELEIFNSGTTESSITGDLLASFGEYPSASATPDQHINVKSKTTPESNLQKKTKTREDKQGTNDPQESRIPKNCMVEPTYLNQGAVKKWTSSRTGYPVVIEYECDQMADEQYMYFSGPREALCNDQGTWTLPAMFCIPTSCYSKVADTSKTETTLYGGDTQQDEDGRECQAWTEDEPHSHTSKFKLTGWCYGCGSVADLGNKCRNMDSEAKPWCYTMDPSVRWVVCDLKECAEERKCSRPPYMRSAPALRTELIGQKVHVTYRCHTDLRYMGGRNVSTCDMETGVWEWPDMLCASEKCFHYDHERKRAMYRGNVSTTKTGKSCQRWDSQWPHKHSITTSFFPGLGSLSELVNTCRDPDNEGVPWCYTIDPDSRWEPCPVPECSLST